MSLANDIGRVPPRRPVILLDVDGVLADFTGACLRALLDVGVRRSASDVTSYKIEDALGLDAGARGYMKSQWSRAGFCAGIEPYPYAREGVEMLRMVGSVYAVTAPMWSSPTWQHERALWLSERMDIITRHVISTHAKHLVRGDVLVEDKPETLAAWMEAWPGGVGVLIDRPYNRDVIDGPWHRVACGDWPRIARLAKREHSADRTRR
jgi:5'(3')-deoxyribonucleotidase